MRPSTFPEKLEFWAPDGTRAAVREAAGQEGQTLSEFIRAAIRAQLRRADQVAAGD